MRSVTVPIPAIPVWQFAFWPSHKTRLNNTTTKSTHRTYSSSLPSEHFGSRSFSFKPLRASCRSDPIRFQSPRLTKSTRHVSQTKQSINHDRPHRNPHSHAPKRRRRTTLPLRTGRRSRRTIEGSPRTISSRKVSPFMVCAGKLRE